MKKSLLAVSVLLVARTGLGAVQYEFRQTTTSQIEAIASADFTGRAVIDGNRSRVDFLSGNYADNGMYMILTNGARTQTWIDPKRKSYTEIDAGSVATAIGSTRLQVSNKKIDVVTLDDHPQVAGMPTDHYRINLSFDITLYMGALPVTQSVTEVIDKWTTMAFGDVAETYLASGGLKTGNLELDDLFAQETTRIKGFALRQTSSVTTTSHHGSVAGSALKVARSITQQTEFEVTSISTRAVVAAELFSIPTGYRKATPVHDDSVSGPKMLPLEPSRN
jgi:hypothetical protein